MAVNKKLLQFIAAVWILIYHLWIPLSGSGAEQFLIRIGYVGVDLFFFLAAYSLADKELDYAGFLRDRFLRIYLKFALFVLVAAIYKSWSLIRVCKVLTCIEFFERGGGSFLWFLPTIMLFYIFYPLFLKWKWKYKYVVVLVVWFALSLLLDKGLGYSKCFIFTNRIPVMLAGCFLKTHSLPKWTPIVCIPVGGVLLYLWGNMPKLNVPFQDFFYVLAIVLVIGIAGVSAYIKPSKAIGLLGSATIEMYALQMIFGPAVVTWIYRMTTNKLLTDLLMLVVTIAASIVLSKIYDKICFSLQRK